LLGYKAIIINKKEKKKCNKGITKQKKNKNAMFWLAKEFLIFSGINEYKDGATYLINFIFIQKILETKKASINIDAKKTKNCDFTPFIIKSKLSLKKLFCAKNVTGLPIRSSK
jgi:hypothetical protein